MFIKPEARCSPRLRPEARCSPRLGAARGSGPRLGAARGSGPRLGAARGSGSRLGAARGPEPRLLQPSLGAEEELKECEQTSDGVGSGPKSPRGEERRRSARRCQT